MNVTTPPKTTAIASPTGGSGNGSLAAEDILSHEAGTTLSKIEVPLQQDHPSSTNRNTNINICDCNNNNNSDLPPKMCNKRSSTSSSMSTTGAPHPSPSSVTTSTTRSSSREGRELTTTTNKPRPFYGRKKELELLKKQYQEATSPTSNQSESAPTAAAAAAVLIEGVSGTGKTALVQHFVQSLTQQQVDDNKNIIKPLVLRGKYEELTRQDPFSGIEQAFGGDGCLPPPQRIVSSSSDTFQTDDDDDHMLCNRDWAQAVVDEIGGEDGLRILQGILPALTNCLISATTTKRREESSSETDSDSGSSPGTTTTTSSPAIANTHQLHHVFGRLVRALTKAPSCSRHSDRENENIPPLTVRGRPLLLILEDLQWMDSASLDLLEYLMTLQIPNFICIATCRTTTSTTTGATTTPQQLVKLKKHPGTTIISLQNHTQEEITECIGRELRCTALQCQVLASAIYQKTEGNFFCTRQLLDGISNRFANNSSSPVCWEDDNGVLQWVEQSNACSITDAVSDKIQHLPNPEVKQVLILASFLGSQFNVQTLQGLLAAQPQQQRLLLQAKSRHELVQILDSAVLEGLLYNAVGSLTYQFVHDGIQETVNSMIPVGTERDQLLYQIGHFLKGQASSSSDHQIKDGNDSMLFLAARLWSEIGQITHYINPVELAKLQLQCGNNAREKTAFEVAADCFGQGLDLMISSLQGAVHRLWRDHYDLALQLHQSSAEAELLLGHYERGYVLGQAVLDNAKTLLEKMPTYYAMDAAMGLQDRHADALALNMEVLAELGEVPTTLKGIGDFFQVKRLINNTSDEEILALPEMTDPIQIAITRCLGNAGTRAFCSGSKLLMIAITMKQVKRILRLGLSSQAPLVFAGYGCALLAGMGHANTGRRMGRLARDIASKRGFDKEECKALYIVASFIELWTEPLPQVIKTYERARDVGLMNGVLDYGYGAELEAIEALFVAGEPIDSLLPRFLNLKKMADQYNIDTMLKIMDPLGTLLFHLAGQSPASGGGGVSGVNWESLDLNYDDNQEGTSHYAVSWVYLFRMILAFYLGNLALAERMAKKFNDNHPGQSFFFCTLGSYFSGLLYARLAHVSRSSKYKKLANKYTKEMRKLVDNGCAKNSHRHRIMKASYVGISSPHKHSIVQQAYDAAIAAAGDSGCIHDHALANELAGEYFLGQRRPQIAKRYLVQACSLYRKWGANAKLNQMLKAHASILTEADLPAIFAEGRTVHDENEHTKYYPIISIGSTAEVSNSDDLSALTPIPENRSILAAATNRWANCTSTKKDKPASAPPKLPKRYSARSPDDATSAGTSQTEALSD